jgi:acetamidase/formamidase
MQIKENYTAADMKRINENKFDGAVGPIYVEGAKQGDALEISLIDIQTGTWGWSAILSNFGLLKGRFKEELVIWNLKNGYATPRTKFLNGVRIPLKPFLGVVGTAPRRGEFGMIPPQTFGGNMDNRLFSRGAVLTLPVNQKGALLSLADPHGAQGDGEVCGTAIETSAEVILKVNIRKDTKVRYPSLVSREKFEGNEIVSMGISPNLKVAASTAVMEMIKQLEGRGFSPEEGYILCSVAGNLRISEIVDEPNFVVSVVLPEEVAGQRTQ